MVDIPIELVWLIVSISVAIPILIMFFDKSGSKIFLAMSLFIIGCMWIMFFAFGADNIVNGQIVQSSTYDSETGTTTYSYSDDLIPLADTDGVWNNNKTFLTLMGVFWVVMAIVVEKGSIVGNRGYSS